MRALSKFQKTLFEGGEGYQWTSKVTLPEKSFHLPEKSLQEICVPNDSNQNSSFEEEPSWLFEQVLSQEKEDKKIVLYASPLFLEDLQGPNVDKLIRYRLKNISSHSDDLKVEDLSPSGMTSADHQRIYRHILDLKKQSSLKEFFQKSCYTDVPVTGVIEGKTYVTTIDRLFITALDIEIIDYQSSDLEKDSKQLSRTQRHRLKIHWKLLQALYPYHQIKIKILWLQKGILEDISFSEDVPFVIREAG